jgi:hypothetical protein
MYRVNSRGQSVRDAPLALVWGEGVQLLFPGGGGGGGMKKKTFYEMLHRASVLSSG